MDKTCVLKGDIKYWGKLQPQHFWRSDWDTKWQLGRRVKWAPMLWPWDNIFRMAGSPFPLPRMLPSSLEKEKHKHADEVNKNFKDEILNLLEFMFRGDILGWTPGNAFFFLTILNWNPAFSQRNHFSHTPAKYRQSNKDSWEVELVLFSLPSTVSLLPSYWFHVVWQQPMSELPRLLLKKLQIPTYTKVLYIL